MFTIHRNEAHDYWKVYSFSACTRSHRQSVEDIYVCTYVILAGCCNTFFHNIEIGISKVHILLLEKAMQKIVSKVSCRRSPRTRGHLVEAGSEVSFCWGHFWPLGQCRGCIPTNNRWTKPMFIFQRLPLLDIGSLDTSLTELLQISPATPIFDYGTNRIVNRPLFCPNNFDKILSER